MKLSEKLISVTCNAEGLVCIGSSGDRAIFREVIDKLKEIEKSADKEYKEMNDESELWGMIKEYSCINAIKINNYELYVLDKEGKSFYRMSLGELSKREEVECFKRYILPLSTRIAAEVKANGVDDLGNPIIYGIGGGSKINPKRRDR